MYCYYSTNSFFYHFLISNRIAVFRLPVLASKKSISIYYEQLNSGANISVNKDLRLWPASLTKLPVALVVMKKIESGGWSEDTTPSLSYTRQVFAIRA
jgi:D-alanyl-D-alanine carboxypeptidase